MRRLPALPLILLLLSACSFLTPPASEQPSCTPECSENALCVLGAAGAACVDCPTGFTVRDGACVDVDECADDPCGEGETCVNAPGTHRCETCPAGSGVRADGSCVDVDECADGVATCAADELCLNTPGEYVCHRCPEGFAPNGTACVDIDECARPDTCAADERCRNLPASHACDACPAGYAFDAEGTCVDIDECDEGVEGEPACPEGATCTNAVGSYACACPAGFNLDGTGCVDIDECAQPDLCAADERCRNLPGSHTCDICPAGHRFDAGGTCVDIDECDEGVEGEPACPESLTCSNSVGSYSCDCPAGTRLEGAACVEIWTVAANLTDLPQAPYWMGPIGALDGLLYVAAGSSSYATLDPVTGVMSEAVDGGESGGPFCGCGFTPTGAVTIAGSLYYVGNDLTRITPVAPTPWATLDYPYERKRGEAGVAAVGSKLHVLGGRLPSNAATASHQVFDTETGTWESKADLPWAASFIGVATLNGTLYAAGGHNGEGVHQFVRWNAETDEWHSFPDLPEAEGVVRALYATTDRLWFSNGAKLRSWNPVTEAFEESVSLPRSNVGGAEVVAAGDDIYALTTVSATSGTLYRLNR